MTAITAEQAREWLRENVTIVKPGETLVIRVNGLTPSQVHEYVESLNAATDTGYIPFRCLVVDADELGIVPQEAVDDAVQRALESMRPPVLDLGDAELTPEQVAEFRKALEGARQKSQPWAPGSVLPLPGDCA